VSITILPKVVIVGRTNVGKSTLFNRLSSGVKSLTLDYEGVTRDFIEDLVCWQSICFELIDSGGISMHKAQDPLAEKVRQIGLNLVHTADLIIFVCDGKVGMVPQDREIATFLHKLNKKVLVVVNKIDTQEFHLAYEFAQLGFAKQFFISALHGTGIHDILDAIVQEIPKKIVGHKEEAPQYKVVLLGKPNVGKSSLLNLLLEEERALVADQPGTTREAITQKVRFYQETIALTDTPGIRRKRSVTQPIEQMMVKTSFRALENSDIVLLMLDATEGLLSDQELKLAFYAFEHGKALIVLFNKEDMLTEQQKADLSRDLELYHYFFKNIPQLFISCKTKTNVGKILPLVKKVWQRHSQWLNNDQLNWLCLEALRNKPLYHKTERLVVYKVEQVATAPITIILKVNNAQWFGPSQLAFFEHAIRVHYDLIGVPLKLIARNARDNA
jgi:GTP-binding protein